MEPRYLVILGTFGPDEWQIPKSSSEVETCQSFSYPALNGSDSIWAGYHVLFLLVHIPIKADYNHTVTFMNTSHALSLA